jgi:hypothetical protein
MNRGVDVLSDPGRDRSKMIGRDYSHLPFGPDVLARSLNTGQNLALNGGRALN